MKVDKTVCDVCDAEIPKKHLWLRLRKKLGVRWLVEFGKWVYTVDGQVFAENFDVCEDCKDEIVDEVKSRVGASE